jgi:hypothetical protein
VPPGGFSGYNAFHSIPEEEVAARIKELLNVKGWKGYQTLWGETIVHTRLVRASAEKLFDWALQGLADDGCLNDVGEDVERSPACRCVLPLAGKGVEKIKDQFDDVPPEVE